MTTRVGATAVVHRQRPESLGSSGLPRHVDRQTGMVNVKIGPGEYYVTRATDETLVTILGSCVAVCMRDPVAGVGGINHFLLAESETGEWGGVSAVTRYGNHAMETLINDIIHLGGVRSRFEIKVFGGGRVIDSNLPIGANNIQFAETYLANEGMPIAAKHVGGNLPRRIHYYPPTGKVRMLLLRRDAEPAARQELEFKRSNQAKPVAGDVELFG